ncbi:hypothetical protein [Halorussus halophilus]|uniref:hypothetical protein n=1 Tax=Halorussus halophilus TaxID=2650975 RepID=UPI001301295D|nr:hypothetical protein [Halorussus halophilus]
MSLLQRFADDLTVEGYVVETVAENQIADKLGYLTVRVPLVIEGTEFDGELMVNVYEDRIEEHGVDIHSKAGHRFSNAKKSLLNDVASSQTHMGEDWITWTYHSQPTVEDNIPEFLSTFEEIFQRVRKVA